MADVAQPKYRVSVGYPQIPIWVPLSDRLEVLQRFTAKVYGPGLLRCELEIEIRDGRPECLAIHCHGRPGSGVTGKRLRDLALDTYVREATATASRPRGDSGDGWTWASQDVDQFTDALSTLPARRRRRRVDDEHLRRVAAVYSEAMAKLSPHPVEEVVDVFRVSRSTAGRWVMLARQRGFLGPTKRGRAGGVAAAVAAD